MRTDFKYKNMIETLFIHNNNIKTINYEPKVWNIDNQIVVKSNGNHRPAIHACMAPISQNLSPPSSFSSFTKHSMKFKRGDDKSSQRKLLPEKWRSFRENKSLKFSETSRIRVLNFLDLWLSHQDFKSGFQFS